MLLRAGLPIDQALETAGAYTESPPVKALIKRLFDKVRSGVSLADAMAAEGDAFDRFAVGMTRAGEASGALDTVLAKTGEFLERTHKSMQNLRSALLYPGDPDDGDGDFGRDHCHRRHPQFSADLQRGGISPAAGHPHRHGHRYHCPAVLVAADSRRSSDLFCGSCVPGRRKTGACAGIAGS